MTDYHGFRVTPAPPDEPTAEEHALRHLNIDTDHEREEDGSYLTSIVDLRPTGDNYAYVTVAYTDNGDTEKVAVVCVTYPEFDTPQVQPVHCWTVMHTEM